jgi:hypothetical protein
MNADSCDERSTINEQGNRVLNRSFSAPARDDFHDWHPASRLDLRHTERLEELPQ